MRVAFIWNRLSGFHNACLKELARHEGTELFVCHEAVSKSAPYEESQFSWMKKRIAWRTSRDLSTLQEQLHQFQPDILIFASWNTPAYRAVAKSFAGKAFRVMGMDNCWRGTLKQWVGTMIAPFYVRPLADAVWLPGERQATLARKLGFRQSEILRGSLSCDQQPMADVYLERVKQGRRLPHRFLYVGRFAPEKGLDTLVNAYAAYRESCADPWPLLCVGAGPRRSILENKEGIRIEDFVQPEHLPATLASAGCFVLTSDFEQWSVVVHEATSAGLPVIASERVGAAAHLVQPNYNGFIFGSGDVEELAGLMSRVSAMSDERLEEMSQASFQLSQQYSPRRWVDTLFESYSAAERKRAGGSSTCA
jgi:glycosyltransferase involved in cell wall biosynthesis